MEEVTPIDAHEDDGLISEGVSEITPDYYQNQLAATEGELPIPHDENTAQYQEVSEPHAYIEQPEGVAQTTADVEPGTNLQPVETHQYDAQPSGFDYGGANVILPPLSDEQSVVPERSQPIIQERETVVEKRGSTDATLLGAIAANRLSESRDRKVQTEAKRLKKKAEKLQKDQKKDMYEIERLRVRSQKQALELRQKRESASQHAQNGSEVASLNTSQPLETEKPQQFSQTEVKTQTTPEVTQRAQEVKQDSYEKNPEVAQYEIPRRTEVDPVVLEQVEQAAEQNIALERYFERRHEVKDVPTNSTGQSGVDLGVRTTSVQAQDFATQTKHQLTRLEEQQRKALQTQQVYKHAATQGVMAGIILLVSFALLAFIWSLLN